tara:strand:- start:1535 stop:1723 length:189 start_codon:yes stop_codon:yes gene_type:complete
MSKAVKQKYKEEAKTLDKPTIKDSLESLKIQFEDYTKKAKHFSNMALKAQGAIEVLSQIDKD